MQSQLKPCPFCGSKYLEEMGAPIFGDYYVKCRECAGRGPLSLASHKDARSKWNRRPEDKLEDDLK